MSFKVRSTFGSRRDPRVAFSLALAVLAFLPGCGASNRDSSRSARRACFKEIVDSFKAGNLAKTDFENQIFLRQSIGPEVGDKPTLCLFRGEPYYLQDRHGWIRAAPSASADVEYLFDIESTTRSGWYIIKGSHNESLGTPFERWKKNYDCSCYWVEHQDAGRFQFHLIASYSFDGPSSYEHEGDAEESAVYAIAWAFDRLNFFVPKRR